MKKNISGFFLLLVVNFHSQVTLQSNTHRPVAGDTLKQYIIDTSAFMAPMPNNISGNNVTWNYSSIINTGSILSQAYVSNTAVASSTNFSGCNLVLNLGAGTYNYLKTVNTPTPQLELLGLNFGTFAQVTFTNSAILFKYPVSFGNSFSDPASGTFSANTGTTTINGTATGNFSSQADGFGTLILGQQAIPNILRVKSTQNFTLFQGFLPLGTIRSVIYSYYDQNQKFPLFQIQYQTLSLIAQSPSTTATVRMNAGVPLLGLKENIFEKNFKIFPCPAKDYVNVAVEISGNYRLEIHDLKGKCVFSIVNGTKDCRLNVDFIPDGMYFITIKDMQTGEIFRQPFIKLNH